MVIVKIYRSSNLLLGGFSYLTDEIILSSIIAHDGRFGGSDGVRPKR